MLLGKEIDDVTHEVTSFLNTTVNGLSGTYFGEIHKDNKRPDGRGVFKADDGKVFVRNF